MINLHYKSDLPERIEYEDAIKLSETFLNDTLKRAHRDINDITSYIAKAKGKGIRSKMLIVSSIGEDDLVPLDAIKAAAAIEVLHLATLVHDDVIDDASMRRGIESVQRHFGKRQAVISGDYLFCLSFYIISDIYNRFDKENYNKFASEFADMMGKICIGELNQFKNNTNLSLKVMDYLKIISGKTASLFGISTYTGSIIGECHDIEKRILLRFGRYLGMIFQIIDDCKDYEFSEERAKKSVKKDIEQGVVTLPLILSMLKNNELKAIAKDAIVDYSKSELLIHEVFKAGGIRDAIIIASKYYKKSKELLLKLEDTKKYKLLLDILNETGDIYLKLLKDE